MRVLLAGGGSAGHIEPALAVADAVLRLDSRAEVTCLGTERGLETRLIPLRGYPLELIPAVPMPRSMTPTLLTVPGRLAGAVNAAAAVIDRMHGCYPRLAEGRDRTMDLLAREQRDFGGVVRRGLDRLAALDTGPGFEITGDEAFTLFATHGMPVDLIRDFAAERGGRLASPARQCSAHPRLDPRRLRPTRAEGPCANYRRP